LAFATFLVWRLRTGACGIGACGFWRYRMPPAREMSSEAYHGAFHKLSPQKILFWQTNINPTALPTLPPSNAVRKRKNFILEDLLSSVLSHFKKYQPLWKPEI